MGFTARYILIKPPSSREVDKQRLSSTNIDEHAAQSILDRLPQYLDPSKTSQLFDHTLSNEADLDVTSQSLSAHIFGNDNNANRNTTATGTNGVPVAEISPPGNNQEADVDGANSASGVETAGNQATRTGA